MRTVNRSSILALPILLLALGTARSEEVGTIEVQIIVQKSLAVSELTSEDLESIYLGKMTLWESGSKVEPVILVVDSPAGRAFVEETLSKTVAQYRSYWKRKTYSGGGVEPHSFPKSEEIVEFVAKTPGAIGVVEGEVKDERVKVIKLAKPDEPL